jgi:hypothetical protein
MTAKMTTLHVVRESALQKETWELAHAYTRIAKNGNKCHDLLTITLTGRSVKITSRLLRLKTCT